MTTFQSTDRGDTMLTVEEAQRLVLEAVPLLGTDELPLHESLGRVLREDVVATRDLPSADNSAMDGYAVRAEDVATPPARLKVIDDIPAGRVPTSVIEPETAARIMTGAPIPAGADAVVQVEWTNAGFPEVEVKRSVTRGMNIRRAGEDMRAGDVVIKAGSVIGAGEIGVLAAVRARQVRVAQRATLALFATGDEIVTLDRELAAGQISNSNSYTLAALAREAGAHVNDLGVVPDDLTQTIAALERARGAHFIVSSGGVSAGAFDFVKDALDRVGASTSFWRVAMKPGKPIVFSRVGNSLFFGLPGNPVSCMVAFTLFVLPAIRKASGQSSSLLPPTVRVRLASPVKSTGDRRNYLRASLSAIDGELVADPKPAQGSGVTTSMVGANAFVIVPEGVTRVEAGELVEAMIVGQLR